jgi:hypothetical protein
VDCIGECIPLVEINISLLADQVGVTASDTLDLGQGVHDLLLSLDIGVQKSQDELEVRLLGRYERHDGDCCGEVAVAIESCQRKCRKSSGREEVCGLTLSVEFTSEVM